jgi:Prokaryotic N-terminal methylation motif
MSVTKRAGTTAPPSLEQPREEGFTLIEVLVGFVIVTMALVTFFSGLGLSYRQMAESRLRQAALAHAQSHLASLVVPSTPPPGASSGRYAQGTPWRLTVSALAGSGGLAGPALASGPGPSAQAQLLVLDTFDARGRLLLRLKTVKLAVVQR